MKKVDFLAKVKEEANHLKNALTSEQKAMLDYSKLNPHTHDGCLLAQIFGSFDTDEAKAVLPKSVRITINFGQAVEIRKTSTGRLSYDDINFSYESLKSTFLEAFLVVDTNSEDLFKFIKGEVDEFEPSFNEVAETETL